MSTTIKAPFPYFGGKSKIAPAVWHYLGVDIVNYVEPFAGSLAVLLARPGGAGKIETINDYDGLLANAWRAMRYDPERTAEYANWPVNEADLHARHLWLVGRRESITAHLMGDPEWYDARAAGWWIWGACIWIGSGWCSGNGPWVSVDGVFTDSRNLPHLGDSGTGVNRKLPHLGTAGTGVNRKLPHLGDSGKGINRQSTLTRGDYIRQIFTELSARLRNVRVACGDFERVLGDSVTVRHGQTGVFLDPPYAGGNTDPYANVSDNVAQRALNWAMLNGERMRIVLCGYEGEHNILQHFGWRTHAWAAHGGYGSQGNGAGRDNKHRETLWVSPTCP